MKKKVCFVTECFCVPYGAARRVQFSGSKRFAAELREALAARGFRLEERPPVIEGWPWCKWLETLDTESSMSDLTSALLDYFEDVVRVEQKGNKAKYTNADGRPWNPSRVR